MACSGCEKRRKWLKEKAATVGEILSGERSVLIGGKSYRIAEPEKAPDAGQEKPRWSK